MSGKRILKASNIFDSLIMVMIGGNVKFMRYTWQLKIVIIIVLLAHKEGRRKKGFKSCT